MLEWLERPSVDGVAAASGMNSASTTPASVACTPDFSTHTQSTTPISR